MSNIGTQIGKKFALDGTPLHYPGNTIIADIVEGSSGYEIIKSLASVALNVGLKDSLIMLPECSYHMTVIRGLNDLVRTSEFWPLSLSREASMTLVDDYVQRALSKVAFPGKIKMRFVGVQINDEDFRVLVCPASKEQEETLTAFRDSSAASIGLFLPHHQEYSYHITVAYTRYTPAEKDQSLVDEAIKRMEEHILAQPVFDTTPPYLAFYNDMSSFSSVRIQRTN